VKRFLSITCAAGIIAWHAPLQALAQYANEFTLAKVEHTGTAQHAVAGPGEVTVQVQVNPDGSHKVIRVIRSTNPGDNAAALDIADSSSYDPAHRGAQTIASFYDLVLNFNSTGAVVASAPESMASVEALVRARQYAQAIYRADAILASHPNDQSTLQWLGVAQFDNGDLPAAAVTFDKVTTIGATFVPIAAQAYAGAAVHLSQMDPSQSLAYAQKAYALAPDANSQFALAAAQVGNRQYSSAIASLKALRDSGSINGVKEKENVDTLLLQAYLAVNDTADAETVSSEMKASNPNGDASGRTT
jgi:hypothetical protein